MAKKEKQVVKCKDCKYVKLGLPNEKPKKFKDIEKWYCSEEYLDKRYVAGLGIWSELINYFRNRKDWINDPDEGIFCKYFESAQQRKDAVH